MKKANIQKFFGWSAIVFSALFAVATIRGISWTSIEYVVVFSLVVLALFAAGLFVLWFSNEKKGGKKALGSVKIFLLSSFIFLAVVCIFILGNVKVNKTYKCPEDFVGAEEYKVWQQQWFADEKAGDSSMTDNGVFRKFNNAWLRNCDIENNK